jgi:flagellar L-ring protein precursor FlgH
MSREMKYLMLLAVPALLVAQSPGSLFVPGGRLVDFTRDGDASQVGDLVTILVNESTSALASGVTSSSRKTSATATIPSLLGPANARLANLLGTTGDTELAGSGQTSRTTTIATTIAARVIQVTPGGSLYVEGVKDIGVNSEKQTVTVRGLIRPVDLTSGNVINSTKVANLTVQVNGKGVVGDAIRRPNILYRILLGLLPF